MTATATRKRFVAQPPLKSKARGRLGSKTRTITPCNDDE
jgi:hypothetical protein